MVPNVSEAQFLQIDLPQDLMKTICGSGSAALTILSDLKTLKEQIVRNGKQRSSTEIMVCRDHVQAHLESSSLH